MFKSLSIYVFLYVLTVSPVLAATGAELYSRHCSACHGDNGNGASWARTGLNPPPRNFTTAASKGVLSRERMVNSVTHGRPGTAMQPFKDRLNRDEIDRVVAYIRQRFMGVQVSSNHKKIEKTHHSLGQFPEQLQGDRHLGKLFFQDNCYVCHGRLGNGAGPRAKFIIPRPRNFLAADSSEFDRNKLFTAIANGKPGTVMPAWKTVLSQQQIANVAEYVLQDFILGGQKKNKKN